MTNGRDKAQITQLAILLDNNWEENDKVTVFLASYYNNNTGSKVETEIDALHILVTAIHKPNIGDTNKFTLLTQLDIKELEIYKLAIYGPDRQHWVHAIKKKFNQLKKNKIWTVVSKYIIEPGPKRILGK